ncbi:MAG: WYL domain-containing protein [Bacteroidetes bacterium B1(2017)]|nr:MAG: WYL domain-containing protein [Bacteroidetes bacterium B1(2017)]
MSINKLALIRYKTIDNCLKNRFRKWTLDDLVEACADALYEYEGISKGVSKRTVQLDLQTMRSEKLGYNAPIIVTDKKYYSYEEKGYSITNSPLTQQDIGTLNEVLLVLKQFSSFGFFSELNGMVTRLEDKLYKQQNKGKSFIDFEKNELLKGLTFIDPLHKAIQAKKTISIVYQSFKSRQAQTFVICPYLLKEYRNRWFLMGANKKGFAIMILALDRIESFEELAKESYLKPSVDFSNYFNDVIGVSKLPNQKPLLITMKISNEHAPYILTKPFHSSQKILTKDQEGTIFTIEVIWNYELEREILGFGEQLKVLGPRRISGKIKSRLKQTLAQYDIEKE